MGTGFDHRLLLEPNLLEVLLVLLRRLKVVVRPVDAERDVLEVLFQERYFTLKSVKYVASLAVRG
jgi:hypothetical protein